eukprot:TRINITY_DN29411_c0_g1_i1.p1 TRINITY_DN29411_c0_g1~~TRINITY_DN29411_c0_g1_i1.p1  ORF type:complete len:452 (+),score=30.68 TRINITY_DN29411_c0_g1_i1:23-1357(+)
MPALPKLILFGTPLGTLCILFALFVLLNRTEGPSRSAATLKPVACVSAVDHLLLYDKDIRRAIIRFAKRFNNTWRLHRSRGNSEDAVKRETATSYSEGRSLPPTLRTRLCDFMQRFTSEPVPMEFASVFPQCVRFPLGQLPCTDPFGFAAAMPPHSFPPIFDLANNDEGLADLAATRINSATRQAMSKSGLSNLPPLYSSMSTCAVVASAPRLLETHYGKLIDSHDVVIRINLSPADTTAFRSFVGKKRTVEVVNRGNVVEKWIPRVRWQHGLPVSLTNPGKRTTLHLTNTSAYRGERYGRTALVPGISAEDVSEVLNPAWHHALPVGYRLAAMSPDIRRLGNRLYCHLSQNGSIWPHHNTANKGNGTAGTSGFFATLFALSTCSEVSLFGFGLSPKHEAWLNRGSSYFTTPALADDGNNGGHWYTLERYVIHRMAAEGLIKYF